MTFEFASLVEVNKDLLIEAIKQDVRFLAPQRDQYVLAKGTKLFPVGRIPAQAVVLARHNTLGPASRERFRTMYEAALTKATQEGAS
jgi:hypothetical protein